MNMLLDLGVILLIAAFAMVLRTQAYSGFYKHNLSYPLHGYFQPEQLHLSYGETTSDIVVTWSTPDPTINTICEYGIGVMDSRAIGQSKHFVDGGRLETKQTIHKVTLQKLKPRQTYVYHCGSDWGWSNEFWFRAPPAESSTNWAPHLAVYGDMGSINAVSIPHLQEEVQRDVYDAILHLGDFAYDMNDQNGRVGDIFMRNIEPIASRIPYMVCVGNHEEAYNFSHYKSRFNMPGETQNLFYSFNLGPAHFVGFSTEVYFPRTYYSFNSDHHALLRLQDVWLRNDLKEANKPKNRSKHPWIITFGHRPMYCTNVYNDDCTIRNSKVRTGISILHNVGLEKLFYDHGVDLELWAHEHSYERLWPLYNYTVFNGSEDHPYTNPRAPVHIITGSAGCNMGTDLFKVHKTYWSAFRNSDYGYSRLKIYNATHLHMEQVSDDMGGAVVDEMWLIKDTHGAYNK